MNLIDIQSIHIFLFLGDMAKICKTLFFFPEPPVQPEITWINQGRRGRSASRTEALRPQKGCSNHGAQSGPDRVNQMAAL